MATSSKDKLQAVFIDRDGTLGGTGHFIHPNDFSPFPYSLSAINLLKDKGLKVIAITNQHRISTGVVTREDFEDEFRKMGFDGWYICPHSQQEACSCKKPSPGLLLQAAEDFQLNLKQCVLIGDVGSTDMLAAHAVGSYKILVRTGWGNESLGKYRATWAETEPDFIAENLLEATRYVLNHLMRCNHE